MPTGIDSKTQDRVQLRPVFFEVKMKKLYDICGLTVECDLRYPEMTRRAEKYLSCGNNAPDISIPFSQQEIDRLRSAEPHLSLDDCEIMSTSQSFYMQLLRHGGFMLHSSAVAVDNAAYLFSAPSGTGKSTHTQQWVKLFGERAQILNDDKPAIMVSDSGITACGTPWSGKSDLNVNASIPLRGICFLRRSESNYIERMPPERVAYSILDQTLRPEDGERMGSLLDMLDKAAAKIPVWQMGCNISVQAAQMAYEAMSAGSVD